MAVYGLGCYPQNIIWTEAKLRSIYYFVGDRPVYKLLFGPKCHELFVILYSIFANLSDGPGQYTVILTGSLAKTNRENINVKYNKCK